MRSCPIKLRYASIAAALLLIAANTAPAATPVLKGKTDRPLRYRPEANGFVIDNGPDSFNRPLYGGNTAFRIDAGDKPEFSFYLPGRGGVVRVGVATSAGTKWLRDAEQIQARYADGAMTYRVTDPVLGDAAARLIVVAARDDESLLIRADIDGGTGPVDLIFAYGGLSGEKAKRDGDIGTESVPVSQYFALKTDHCRDNKIETSADGFTLASKVGRMSGACSGEATFAVADARKWDAAAGLRESANGGAFDRPVSLTIVHAKPGVPTIFALRHEADNGAAPKTGPTSRSSTSLIDDLQKAFDKAIQQNRSVARQVVIDTPDSFINSSVNALCVAADAIWDDASGTYMHGGVAWRRPLLGWRGPYAGDATGKHGRTELHLDAYFAKQNTKAVSATQPGADEDQALARSERALRSNGDFTDSHYDMNLVAVDVFFRHLLWTGDLDYARRQWPTIKRHLAWEKRLFRRPFGPDGLPLYEAYAAIWASDDLQYSGGGAAHSSAYNYYHNLMAARVAKLLNEDPTPYQHEADLIRQAMNKYLWLPEQGQFAECRDWLGNQLVHPAAAVWTHYHTIDSLVPDAKQAWQMCRYVDTQIPHIPISGKDVPPGCQTIATSTWMPYTYSINNVVMAETEHTALADWQAGRPDAAFSLYKGALLDSMFLGQCPGNCAMTSSFDPYRQEAQRDFGDPIGITWRATVEGLFGITPDALANELTIKPGFPAEWDHASLTHPNINMEYWKTGLVQTFEIEPTFALPMRLHLQLPALRTQVRSVQINGVPASFSDDVTGVGQPRLDIDAPAAKRWSVVVEWGGDMPAAPLSITVPAGQPVHLRAGGWIAGRIINPQSAVLKPSVDGRELKGIASTKPGTYTMFLDVVQGAFIGWQPVQIEITPAATATTSHREIGKQNMSWQPVELSAAFNDVATNIFKNKYVSPRSPFCSLALPVQGFGGWSTNKTTPTIDDAGLRAAGGKITLPQGISFTTPTAVDAKNVLFVSQWDNYPHEATVPLMGKSGHAYLLMAGTTGPMQSRLENGEVIATYVDGTTDRLALRNPETWWPIEQDYFVDDYGFNINAAIPPRVDLKTGKVRLPTRTDLSNGKQKIDGGSATVLDLPLDSKKELKSLTIRAIANDVVIGLMAVTLQRPG